MSRWTPPRIEYDSVIGEFRRRDPPVVKPKAPVDQVRRLLVESFRDTSGKASHALNVPEHMKKYIPTRG